MIDFTISPSGPLTGELTVPGDKSISHRAVLLGAIANGLTTIRRILLGEDVQMTMNAFRACGVQIEVNDSTVTIEGKGLEGLQKPRADIYCGNSGTALRLMMGLFSGQRFPVRFTGDESLSCRPMRRVVDPLQKMGACIRLSSLDTPPVDIFPTDKLQPIEWKLPVASAQVKSAILLAGLYTPHRTTVIEPEVTRDHTENLLRVFGCPVESDEGRISATGGIELNGQQLIVPSDFSSAAFFVVAALLIPGSDITIKGVGVNSTRTGLLDVLKSMGGSVEVNNERMMGTEKVADLRVKYVDRLEGIVVNPEVIPRMIDEVPIFAVAAANANGVTVLSGCEELRVKESDRIRSTAKGLEQIGVSVSERSDGIIIEGGKPQGGVVDSYGDHRIAMAFAVAGAVSKSDVRVRNCACVNTSFPGFASTASDIGIGVHVEGND